MVTDLAGGMLDERSLSVPAYGNVAGSCVTLVRGLREGNRTTDVLGVGVRADGYASPIHPPVAPTMTGATGLATMAFAPDQGFWQMAGVLVHRHVADRMREPAPVAADGVTTAPPPGRRAPSPPARDTRNV